MDDVLKLLQELHKLVPTQYRRHSITLSEDLSNLCLGVWVDDCVQLFELSIDDLRDTKSSLIEIFNRLEF